jgi:sulfopyruvate decarboxylase subunit beta
MAAVKKSTAIETIIAASSGSPTVFTTGYTSRIARGVADRPSHFYMVGSMGLAASIGTGVALQTGQTTFVVNGDGALLMNPVDVMTAGIWPHLRLVHIVLDDGKYDSTGGQEVPSSGVDLTALAQACGYRRTFAVYDTQALFDLVSAHRQDCPSPTFIHCVIRATDDVVPGRIDSDLSGHARRFTSHLANLPL